jgi:hypothetical protein
LTGAAGARDPRRVRSAGKGAERAGAIVLVALALAGARALAADVDAGASDAAASDAGTGGPALVVSQGGQDYPHGGTLSLPFGAKTSAAQTATDAIFTDFSFSNAGTAVLTITKIATSPGTPPCGGTGFAAPPPVGDYQPGAGATFQIKAFSPGTACAYDLAIESNDLETPHYVLHVAIAAPVGPHIELVGLPGPEPFSTPWVPTRVTSFGISNTGTDALHVSALSVDPEDGATGKFDPNDAPFDVAPGATHDVTISVTVAKTQGYSPGGMVTAEITSNDPVQPVYGVTFRIEAQPTPPGAGACALAAAPAGPAWNVVSLAALALALGLAGRRRR